MELRKFYATNMREAMDLVRRELGDGAVVLDMRTIRDTETPGSPSERVEIWAQGPQGAETPATPPALDLILASSPQTAPLEEPPVPVTMEEQLNDLRGELQAIRAQLQAITVPTQFPAILPNNQSRALARCITESLIEKMPLAAEMEMTGKPHVVALIGPNGAGKTTLAAKMAWEFAVQQNHRVGVVTTDTYRVGALEQIRTYCGHMDLPLEVVYRPEQMPEALARLASCDLVLIDTPGNAGQNPEYVREMQEMLAAANPSEVHLVISASLSPLVINDVMENFRVLHPKQMAITRLDETRSPWEAFTQVFGSGMALSYLTAGPTITRAFGIASVEMIHRFLPDEESVMEGAIQ